MSRAEPCYADFLRLDPDERQRLSQVIGVRGGEAPNPESASTLIHMTR
ncbi:hypothetical protein [Frondihabitans sp. PAMC 28766]|nr:hypothetical protein [Frondihabitans sp. PAMC 28766]